MSFHFSLFCPLRSLANSFPSEYFRELFTFLFRAKFSLIEYCLIQIGHQEPLGCRDFHYSGICYMGLHPSLKFSIGFKLNSFSPAFQKVRYNCPKTSPQFLIIWTIYLLPQEKSPPSGFQGNLVGGNAPGTHIRKIYWPQGAHEHLRSGQHNVWGLSQTSKYCTQ